MLSYSTLFSIACLLPQAFALLRVPVGPQGDLFSLTKKDTVDIETSVQTYIIPGTNFYFGSEHEKAFVSFDTGSYTSYVQDSSISQNGFDGNKSSTLARLGKDYQVNYADGTGFKGEWVADDVAFDDQYSQHANLTFGLVTDASDSSNIFGLGFYPDSQDPTFIDTLFVQEVISKRVFSVYQNEVSKGEFTFGGVDTAKFDGDLVAIPVIDEQAWNVKLFDVFHGCESLTNGNSYPILIDSGSSTGLYFPEDVFYKLINELEAQYESNQKAYVFDCANSKSITLDFGGVQVEIPTSSFVQEIPDTDYCAVNWRISSEGSFQLGWTFFDNFYFVFDADSKEILIGKPNKKVTDSNIVEVTDSVPSSTKAESYSQTETSTGNSIDYTSASTVSLFASSASLGSYYTGSTGFTTCTASSSSASSSASSSSSAISSSISSAVSSSSAISSSSSSAISSSSSASAAGESSSASSVESSSFSSSEPNSASSVETSSSAPSSAVTSSSSIASDAGASSEPVSSSAVSSSVAASSFYSPSSFSTVTPSSSAASYAGASSSASAVSSSFSGYFNNSGSSTALSSESSTALPSSTASPSISGSFIDGAPVWDIEIPSELGPWAQISVSSEDNEGITFKDVILSVNGSRVSPSIYQKNQDSFNYNYNDVIEDGQVLIARIFADAITAASATIDVTVAITDNSGAKFVKRATQTFDLSNTINAPASTVVSSLPSDASSAPDSSAAPASSTDGSESAQSSSSVASTNTAAPASTEASATHASATDASASAGQESTSTATVENVKTTVATVTSCSDNACSEHTTTAAVTTVTKRIGNIVNVYTTYCPFSDESSASGASTTTQAVTTSPIEVETQSTAEASQPPAEESNKGSDAVEGTSTQVVQVTSTLPNGDVTTVASTPAGPALSSDEGASTDVVQITSTLPNGDVTTVVTTPAANTDASQTTSEAPAGTTPAAQGEQSSNAPEVSTQIVQVTSTLPNGETTVVQSQASSPAEETTNQAPVSTKVVPTSTGDDTTYFVTQLVTETTEPSSAPAVFTQPSYNGTNGTQGNAPGAPSPASVSSYEGAGNRLAVGVLGAIPIVMMFF